MIIDDTLDNSKFINLSGADSSFSLVEVALVSGLHESWLAQEVVSELCWVLRLLHLSFSPSIAHSFVRACKSLGLLLYCIAFLQEVSQPNLNESSGGHLRFGCAGSNCSTCLKREGFFILGAMRKEAVVNMFPA